MRLLKILPTYLHLKLSTYLARDDLDLEGLLEVLLIDDADLLSGVDGAELVHNIFVELLGLSAQELWASNHYLYSSTYKIFLLFNLN